MASLRDILYAEEADQYFQPGGQSTLQSMLGGLESGEVIRGRGFGNPARTTEIESPDGGEGGGPDYQMIGSLLGLDPERVSTMLQQGHVAFTPDQAMATTAQPGRELTASSVGGRGMLEALQAPAGGGRDYVDPFAASGSGRDAYRPPITRPAYQQQVAREAATDVKQQAYNDRISTGDPAEMIFNNLLRLSPEELKQVDFSDENALTNLSQRGVYNLVGQDGKTNLDAVLGDNGQGGFKWTDFVGKTVLPGIIKAGTSAINPFAGAAASALIDYGQSGGKISLGDLAKGTGVGLAGSLGASALGGAISGGTAAYKAGEGVVSGALGGAGEGVAGAATSSGLRAAGDTLVDPTKTASALDVDAVSGAQVQYGAQDPVSGLIYDENYWNKAAQLSQLATTPKELGVNTLKGAAPTIISGLLNSLGGFGTGPSKGLYVDDAGTDPLLGTIESGLGLLDPFSEQQTAGLGVL